MADEYIFEPNRKGGGRIKSAEGGCGSLIVLIIIIIIGIAISASDTGGNTVSLDQNIDYGYIWLTDLSPAHCYGIDYTSEYDVYANENVKLTHLLSLSDSDNGKGCVEYDLSDGGYKYITGCLAGSEKHSGMGYKASLIIYADGDEIYRIDEMIAGNAPIDFRLDIRDAQRIRIELSGHECFCVADLKLWTKTPD